MRRLLEFRVVLILVFVDDMSPDIGLENWGCSKTEPDKVQATIIFLIPLLSDSALHSLGMRKSEL